MRCLLTFPSHQRHLAFFRQAGEVAARHLVRRRDAFAINRLMLFEVPHQLAVDIGHRASPGRPWIFIRRDDLIADRGQRLRFRFSEKAPRILVGVAPRRRSRCAGSEELSTVNTKGPFNDLHGVNLYT